MGVLRKWNVGPRRNDAVPWFASEFRMTKRYGNTEKVSGCKRLVACYSLIPTRFFTIETIMLRSRVFFMGTVEVS